MSPGAEGAVEPFYTTKEVGKGTGLASVVYSFAKHRGATRTKAKSAWTYRASYTASEGHPRATSL